MKSIILSMMILTSNEKVTLYPMIPDPSNEGAVHMYTEQRLQAENLKVSQSIIILQKKQSMFSGDPSTS